MNIRIDRCTPDQSTIVCISQVFKMADPGVGSSDCPTLYHAVHLGNKALAQHRLPGTNILFSNRKMRFGVRCQIANIASNQFFSGIITVDKRPSLINWIWWTVALIQGELVSLPCGHWVMHECLDEANDAMEQFVV